jgi:uncharacterized protein
MTVEIRPLGVKCNIKCSYCYQNSQRLAASHNNVEFDFETIKKRVEATNGGGFSLFGGEPLLTPIQRLEEIFAWGLEKYGRNRLQTNGTLVSKRHIELFKRFNVTVGVSLDGPGQLNDARWAGSLRNTRLATRKVEAAIERLCDSGIDTNMIITLHRLNASEDRLPYLSGWIKYLDAIGVKSIRLHVLEIDDPLARRQLALSEAENIRAFSVLEQIEPSLKVIRLDMFVDVERMLMGDDRNVTCTFRGCDTYDTRAVQGIEADGSLTNCGRTNKDGVDFIKADYSGFERYIVLYDTPQEHGGCKGCRFFVACKGQCPGTAIGGDWRNRSENCSLWKSMFERTERELVDAGITPLSLDTRLPKLEETMLMAWRGGRNPDIYQALKRLPGA